MQLLLNTQHIQINVRFCRFLCVLKLKVTKYKQEPDTETHEQDLNASQESLHSFALLLPLLTFAQFVVLYVRVGRQVTVL